jgi:hypothetical protein
MAVNKITVDRVTIDKMMVDKMTVDKKTVDKKTVDKMTVDKMTVDKMIIYKMIVALKHSSFLIKYHLHCNSGRLQQECKQTKKYMPAYFGKCQIKARITTLHNWTIIQ